MGTGDHDRAVELLKELGMKTYQAECFAALNTIPSGTAREISDVADVPRTRVYDATEALAEQGFIEVQHTNPQQFRAIPLAEAVQRIREQYELRIERLHETLAALEQDGPVDGLESGPEVWAVASDGRLDERIAESIADAEECVVLVVDDEDGWSEHVATATADATKRDVATAVVTRPDVRLDVECEGIEQFSAELPWLRGDDDSGDIARLLLVDDESALVTTEDGDQDGEQAIVAEGEGNGAVILGRQLLAEALPDAALPE